MSQSRQLGLKRPPLIASTLLLKLPMEKPATNGSPPVPVERGEENHGNCPCLESLFPRVHWSMGPGGAISKGVATVHSEPPALLLLIKKKKRREEHQRDGEKEETVTQTGRETESGP